MKKKLTYLLIAFGLLGPLASFLFSEQYEGEGAWITRIYEGEVVFKEGVRIKDFRRAGTASAPRISPNEVRKNLDRLVDPQVSTGEKMELLAGVDPEFRGLPPAEREKVLKVLTPGELAGAYIAAAGYQAEQVLGPALYAGRTSIPYRYVFVGGIILIFLGALMRVW